MPGCNRQTISIRWCKTSSRWRNIQQRVCIPSIGRTLWEPMPHRSISYSLYATQRPANRYRTGLVARLQLIGAILIPQGYLARRGNDAKTLLRCSPGLERQLRTFMQLPFRSLDEISLRERLRELAHGVEAVELPRMSVLACRRSWALLALS